jgi:hypothetical protein
MRSAFRARNGLLAMSLAIGLSAIGAPSVVAECDWAGDLVPNPRSKRARGRDWRGQRDQSGPYRP